MGAYVRARSRRRDRRRPRARVRATSPCWPSGGGRRRARSRAASSRCSPSARALMARPRLILFDEPSLGLAPTRGRDDVRDHRGHPPPGHDRADGRAERLPRAADGRSRLRAGDGPHRAGGRGRATSSPTTTSAARISAGDAPEAGDVPDALSSVAIAAQSRSGSGGFCITSSKPARRTPSKGNGWPVTAMTGTCRRWKTWRILLISQNPLWSGIARSLTTRSKSRAASAASASLALLAVFTLAPDASSVSRIASRESRSSSTTSRLNPLSIEGPPVGVAIPEWGTLPRAQVASGPREASPASLVLVRNSERKTTAAPHDSRCSRIDAVRSRRHPGHP